MTATIIPFVPRDQRPQRDKGGVRFPEAPEATSGPSDAPAPSEPLPQFAAAADPSTAPVDDSLPAPDYDQAALATLRNMARRVATGEIRGVAVVGISKEGNVATAWGGSEASANTFGMLGALQYLVANYLHGQIQVP